jgi:hypothetical protein
VVVSQRGRRLAGVLGLCNVQCGNMQTFTKDELACLRNYSMVLGFSCSKPEAISSKTWRRNNNTRAVAVSMRVGEEWEERRERGRERRWCRTYDGDFVMDKSGVAAVQLELSEESSSLARHPSLDTENLQSGTRQSLLTPAWQKYPSYPIPSYLVYLPYEVIVQYLRSSRARIVPLSTVLYCTILTYPISICHKTLQQPPKYIEMAPKRPIADDAVASQSKKHRIGFKVGPDNLPDGTYRRKGKCTRFLHQEQELTNLSNKNQERPYSEGQDQEILRQTQSSRTHCLNYNPK